MTAPREWSVISATRESKIEDRGELRHWTFPETLPMSSYIFSLHAGPYTRWEDPEFRYPLRLFARQSLAAWVESDLWLEYTRGGFDFYVSLYYQGKPKKWTLQRLVAACFLGPIDGYQINHKDRDPTNNHVDNLERMTPSENQLHWRNNNRSQSKLVKGEKL